MANQSKYFCEESGGKFVSMGSIPLALNFSIIVLILSINLGNGVFGRYSPSGFSDISFQL